MLSLQYPENYDKKKMDGYVAYLNRRFHSVSDIDAIVNGAMAKASAIAHLHPNCAIETLFLSNAKWMIYAEMAENAKNPTVTIEDNPEVDELFEENEASDIYTGRISELEHDVLYAHYVEGHTYADIGRTLGVSREYIRRIHNKAIAKLKKDILR